MFFQKVKYKISEMFGGLRLGDINYSAILINIFYFVVILFLGMNIFTTFNKGVEDIKKFQAEQTTLDRLLAENAKLKQEVEQYNSIEYKKIYARENLNLAEKNETLYYIDRPQAVQQIDKLPEDTIQISLDNNAFWWQKLILDL